MKSSLSKLAISTAAFGLLCGAAIAQEIQEVQVQATRAVNTKLVGRSSSGVPIVEMSLTYRVSLADLNLATNSGANEAARRVNDAAEAACKELNRQFPLATPRDGGCAKAAKNAAMVKVHELVASAEAAGGHG